jgi:hypothetical protein
MQQHHQVQINELPQFERHIDYHAEFLILHDHIKSLIDEEDFISKAFFELSKLLPTVESKLRSKIEILHRQLQQPENLLYLEPYANQKKDAKLSQSIDLIFLPEVRSALNDCILESKAPLFKKLNELIEECTELLKKIERSTDQTLIDVTQLIKSARDSYGRYRDLVRECKGYNRLALCEGRTRLRSFLGYHYVNAGAALRFQRFFREDEENKTGIVMPNRDNAMGGHNVLKFLFFAKVRPDSPLKEEFYRILVNAISEQASAPTELLLLEKRDRAFPVLASKSVEGMSLYDFLESYADLIPLIDISNFSAQFIGSLLACVTDGNATNFMAVIVRDEHHKPIKVFIIAIDSDKLLTKGIMAQPGEDNKHSVTLRSIFCFLPQRLQTIDPSFRDMFLRLSPESVMLTILSELYRKEHYYLGYRSTFVTSDTASLSSLTEKELKEIQIPVHFLLGSFQVVLDRLRQIQAKMREQGLLTYDQLFSQVYPVEHFVYSYAMEQKKTPLKAIDALYGGRLPFIENLPNIPAFLLEKLKQYPHTPPEIDKNETETIVEACHRFLENIDYQSVGDINKQEEILINIMIKFAFLTTLVVRNCDAINGEILEKLGERLPQLTALVLINCPNVKGTSLSTFLNKHTNIHITLDNTGDFSYATLLSMAKHPRLTVVSHQQAYFLTTLKAILPVASPLSSQRSESKASLVPKIENPVAYQFINNIDYREIPDITMQKILLREILFNFSAITTLIIRNCDALDDDQLELLADGLSQLRAIELISCKNLKGRGVSALLRRHPKLQITLVNVLDLSYASWLCLLQHCKALTIVLESQSYKVSEKPRLIALLQSAADCKANQLLMALLLHGAHLLSDIQSDLPALHFACQHANISVVRDLLDCGVPVNRRDNRQGLTALDICLQQYQQGEWRVQGVIFNIILLLLKNGAVDCRWPDKIAEIILKPLYLRNMDEVLREAILKFVCLYGLLNKELLPLLIDSRTTSLNLAVSKTHHLDKDIIEAVKKHLLQLKQLNIAGSELQEGTWGAILEMSLASLSIDYAQAMQAKLSLDSTLRYENTRIHITKVKLARNHFPLDHLIKFIETTQHCVELDLCNCGLTDPTQVSRLASALAKNTSLRVIMLNGNKIGDNGLCTIIKVLITHPHLQELHLDDTGAGCKSAAIIGTLLTKSLTLQKLTLFNAALGDEGVQLLAKGIQARVDQQISLRDQATYTLRHLILNQVGMGPNGAIALARALMFYKTIERLDIDYNEAISNEGAAEFLNMLQINHRITECPTKNIGATGEIAKKLADQVVANQHHHQAALLDKVSIRYQSQRSVGVSAALAAVSSSTSLLFRGSSEGGSSWLAGSRKPSAKLSASRDNTPPPSSSPKQG